MGNIPSFKNIEIEVIELLDNKVFVFYLKLYDKW